MSEIFVQALADNDIDKVLFFLNKNPSLINQPLTQNGDTPLMIAASLGYESLCFTLIKRSASLHTQNRVGETPLSLALASGNQELVKALLIKHPDIRESGINANQDTVLMQAAEKGYESLVSWLLEHNANVLAQNRLGEYPIQFANKGHNDAIVQLIQENTPRRAGGLTLLSRIKAKFANARESLQEHDADLFPLKLSLYDNLSTVIDRLNEMDDLSENTLIDFALLFNGFLDCLISDNEADLKVRLIQLFNARSVMVKGTALDFNYRHDAIINQWLYEMVDLLWKKEIDEGKLSHHRILFDGSLNRLDGKESRWLPFDSDYDPYLDGDIPPPTLPDDASFFRDKQGRIHEVIPFVENAIKQLVKGEIKPEDIWLGTDERDNPKQALTESQLKQLSDRSPAFNELIRYVNERYQAYLCNGIRLKFQLLRDGLLKGDRTHGGSQEYAGADAAEAQVVFTTWWQSLGQVNPSLQQTILSYTIWDPKLNKSIAIKEILNPLLDAHKDAERSSDIFCVETIGQRLETFLKDKRIQAKMSKDSQLSIAEWDDSMLMAYQKMILSELSKDDADQLRPYLDLPYHQTSKLMVWLLLIQDTSKPFSYFDLQALDDLSQYSDDTFSTAIKLLNDAPELLEKDDGHFIHIAIQKDFLPLILSQSDLLSEEDVLNLSYQSLKAYIQKQYVTHRPLSDSILTHSLKQALMLRDNHWLLYLLKQDMVDSAAKLACEDLRYPVLKEGTRIRFRSAEFEGIDYTLLRRQGNQLLLKFGESGPEGDIELSLTNLEKTADITYYDDSKEDFFSLEKKAQNVNWATYALISEDFTLFQYVTSQKNIRPALNTLVDPYTGAFQNERFARDVIYFLAEKKPFELSKAELTCLFNAVVLSEQFQLLTPLLKLGLNPAERVDRYRPYTIKQIKLHERYQVNYAGQWVDCYVKQVHEKQGVIRALLEPVYNRDDSGLLPKWLSLNSDQDRSQIRFHRTFVPLNQKAELPPRRILPFVFEENITSVWKYMIQSKTSRDDSLIYGGSVSRDKQIRYIEALTQAQLKLSSGCSDFLLHDIQRNYQGNQGLLLSLALNDPQKVQDKLKQTLDVSLIEWALKYHADLLLPIFMNWHEPIPDHLFQWFYTLSPKSLSSFLTGLSENISFYHDDLQKDGRWMILFKTALKHQLLMKFHYFFEEGIQNGLINTETVIEMIPNMQIHHNDQIQMILAFFDTSYPINTVSQSALQFAKTLEERHQIASRLEKISLKVSENKKIRQHLVGALIKQFIQNPTQSILMSPDTLEKLISFCHIETTDEVPTFMTDLIRYAMKYHTNLTRVSTLFMQLPPIIQDGIIQEGFDEAIRTRSLQHFKNCVADADLFILNFIKTYQALYRTQGFFKSFSHWEDIRPSLDDIFTYCMHKPGSRSAQALFIVCQGRKGFNQQANNEQKSQLFNLIHKQSRAQRWISRTNLCPEEERTFDYLTFYAKTHPGSRTAQICESLEWGTPSKP